MEFHEGYIVCSSNVKEEILKTRKGFKNYIFLSEKELLEKLTFSVRKKAVYLLMKKYGFSYSLALDYISSLYWIENKTYQIPKLDSINSVLQYLIEKNCIVYDKLFLHRLKQFPVTFIEPIPSKEYLFLKEIVSKYTTVFEVYLENAKHRPIVYEFQNQMEEVHFIFNQIKMLLQQGIALKKIYIIPSDKSYIILLKRCAKAYQIAVQFEAYKNLLSSTFINQFLEQCPSSSSFQEIIACMDQANVLFSKVMDVLNQYELIDESPKSCVPLLTEVFKSQAYPQAKYVESVRIVNEEMVFSKDDYVFYPGFNLGSAPKVCKETGFLTDHELTFLKCSTSYEKTQQNKERMVQLISHTPNIVLTYKLSAKSDTFLPSLLVQELSLQVIKQPKISYGFAESEDNIRLVNLYDTYLKYGHWHEDLGTYGINSAKYKSFKHTYKPLSHDILQAHFMKKPLHLAYSNVKLYFACPFSYFADRILNLNEFKPQMAARLGTFSHAVLEDSYQVNFNFDESVENHKKENCLDAKDAFFFGQMTSVLRNLIGFNKEHEQNSQLDTILQEVHIEVIKDKYTFEGYVDKLMYKIIGNDVYAAIVDYKTGADVISLDNIEDGFHLQLPAYMYLLSKYDAFKNLNLHIIGIYLQKVNIVIFDDKSDVASQMAKKFMLDGYTVAEPSLISLLDPTLPKSTYIKSLSMTKDGFSRFAKIYNSQEQSKIISMVEHLLDSASEQIQFGSFEIVPKRILGKNVSCTFCKYKDICFYEYEDVIDLPHKPFGKAGDEHGMD